MAYETPIAKDVRGIPGSTNNAIVELRDEGTNGTAKKTFILLQRGVEEVHSPRNKRNRAKKSLKIDKNPPIIMVQSKMGVSENISFFLI